MDADALTRFTSNVHRPSWLEQVRDHATLQTEGYRLHLEELRWPNFVFMMLPAVLTTAAATIPENVQWLLNGLSLTSILAGSATILFAVHKTLKCDEYQAECERLRNAYESLAIRASFLLSNPSSASDEMLADLSKQLQKVAEEARAQLSTRMLRRARRKLGLKPTPEFSPCGTQRVSNL